MNTEEYLEQYHGLDLGATAWYNGQECLILSGISASGKILIEQNGIRFFASLSEVHKDKHNARL